MRPTLFIFFLFYGFLQTFAQTNDRDDWIYLQGTIRSAKTQEVIPFGHVTVKNQPIGVVSNDEGNFSLNLEYRHIVDTLVFSAMGFKNVEYKISDYIKKNNLTIYLSDSAYMMTDIIVLSIPAREIVSRSIKSLEKNAPTQPYRLTGFYRTSFRENFVYKRLFEAAVEVYDEGFLVPNGISTEILNSRRSDDFRNYRWKEGANYLASFIYGDFVRNPEGNLRELFQKWEFTLIGITFFENQEVFEIAAELPTDSPYEKYLATLRIRVKDYAIMEMNYDYNWDPYRFKGTDVDSISFLRTGVKVKTIYREYRRKMYLSYQDRQAIWIIVDRNKPGKSQPVRMEIHDELMIFNIRQRQRRQPDEKISEYGDIYLEADAYNRRFWRRYNKPVETALYRAIKFDLEKEESLERQFRRTKVDNLYR